MRSQRIDSMMLYIKENKTVTLEQLCEQFQVSKNTIRRDLPELLETGEFKKIYGGITSSPNTYLKSFSERHVTNLELKQQIAQKAAQYVTDGDIIFIDSGTTTYHMVEFLKDKKDITILSHSLEVFTRSALYPNLRVVSLPGDLDHKTLSFAGLNTTKYLENYNISKAFIATAGLSAESGLTNFSPKEFEIKQTILTKSRENYILADHTKFHNASLLTFSNFENVHAIITDTSPEKELTDYLTARQIDVIVS